MTDDVFRYDTAPARRRWIVETLREQRFVSIADLAGRLGVSDMTIRRDLRKLEDRGEVSVVRGGVHLPPEDTVGFSGRAQANALAKQRIATAATDLIGPQDTIALDAGTTVCALTETLPASFTGSVVTHSIPVIQHFLAQGGTRVVGLGGDLYPVSEAFVGPMTVDAAARLRVRTFFLGAAAVDDRGVYVASDIERPTKLALMDIADQVVLLVDETKFAMSAPVLLCSLDRLDALITDRQPPTAVAERLTAAETRLVVSQIPAGAQPRKQGTA
ncbi:DeoR/GlpR family DNA-binding transcription regulator [Saccharopolyspora phatthalungensis]|uniref:DeoR/GlpR family transcriptional regulator of sugar metabolism n=1 Tax=Saccharopolyspora phatthalungensis TaxID=664693 RepID=A0A840QA60_9PSEU|nr:DeoR/GlpR family DNA-binding transcription regulator [Saccharopolyspora phatthalungensis]MBB5157664.1 DeoR/GlpR family transcriptional regulator of sugar metabolism [Saccharopolyspora phatthalungensis]